MTKLDQLKVAFTDSLLAMERAQLQHEQIKRALMDEMQAAAMRKQFQDEQAEQQNGVSDG
jgi:hypothetical protein